MKPLLVCMYMCVEGDDNMYRSLNTSGVTHEI